MNTLIEVSVNVGESLLICYLLGQLLGVRENSLRSRGIGVAAITLWSSCLNLMGAASTCSVVLTMAANMAFALCCFEGSRAERILSGSSYTLIAMISERITFNIIAPMKFKDLSILMLPGTPRYVMMGIYLLICMGLVMLLGRAGKKRMVLPWRFLAILVLLLGCGAVALERLMDLIISISSGIVPQNAAEIADFICMVIIIILIAMLFLMETLGDVYMQNHELLEQQRIEQYEQKEYELMKNSIRALQTYRHDYKNQLLAMQSLIRQKKYTELETYIKELSGTVVDRLCINSGNSALDAVVSAKRIEAENRRIGFHSELYGADQIVLKRSELTSVMGNLLDNAIESCLRLPDTGSTRIELIVKPKGEMVYIKVKNSSDGIYNQGIGGLQTRKKESGHGIGLGRVRDIVEKEGGFCKYYPESDCFTAVVMLPGREKEREADYAEDKGCSR